MDGPLARLLPQQADSDDAILDAFLQYLKVEGVELYPAQEEAILELFAGKNVILATPTGSGKTMVALALVFRAIARQQRVYYTTPIKALASEKFFDLVRSLSPELVGLATGDASINRDAPVQCATAEILAQVALAQGADAPVDAAVLDEFHYYADRERGRAWQVPLLCLPQTQFLLMSATIGDTTRFEEALTACNGRPTVVVHSTVRPVPLSFKYQEVPIHETVGDLLKEGKAPVYLVNFSQRSASEQAQNLMSTDVCSKEEKRAIADMLSGTHFTTPYGKEVSRYLRHGIGLHHAGLLPKYRLMVEKLAQKGLLKVISGTDTLGVGVNVPIRSVVFTKLCKFDGERTALLTARDFHQIAGRAGRKGFDDVGYVYAQAPEHVIENHRIDQKVAADPSKKKKLVKKKPPEWGYVHWDINTFLKLQTAQPETLQSRFALSHAMVLDVLIREHDGRCLGVAKLIRACHETRTQKRALGRSAIEMTKHLIGAGILEQWPGRAYALAPAVNRDVALQQPLALYLLETLELIKAQSSSYALDVLSLVEAIAEDPRVILERQTDVAKRELLTELKAEGIPYEERMERLEHVSYPKPNAEFIYGTYNAFCERFPWAKLERISPKGVARKLVEDFLGFNDLVREFGAERSEGVLLRYLSDILRIVERTIPEHAKSEELVEIETFLATVVRKTDSSLVDEWEALGRGELRPKASVELEPEGTRDITTPAREFAVLVRNAIIALLRHADNLPTEETHELFMGLPRAQVLNLVPNLRGVVTDARARKGEYFTLEREQAPWKGVQRLNRAAAIAVTPRGVTADQALGLAEDEQVEDFESAGFLEFTVDLDRSKQEGRVILGALTFAT
jgi:superfamily II RNA helicase